MDNSIIVAFKITSGDKRATSTIASEKKPAKVHKTESSSKVNPAQLGSESPVSTESEQVQQSTFVSITRSQIWKYRLLLCSEGKSVIPDNLNFFATTIIICLPRELTQKKEKQEPYDLVAHVVGEAFIVSISFSFLSFVSGIVFLSEYFWNSIFDFMPIAFYTLTLSSIIKELRDQCKATDRSLVAAKDWVKASFDALEEEKTKQREVDSKVAKATKNASQ